MKPCPICGTTYYEGSKICRQCGRALEEPPAQPITPAHDATVRWTGQLPRTPAVRRAIALPKLFASSPQLLIGRAPECDVCLSHPSVSRHHARLEKLEHGLELRDLESLNGVFVNGQRVREPVVILEQQRVGIGPFLFRLVGDEIHLLDSSQSLRLEARGLEKIVSSNSGQPRKLLDNINLTVESGEFVSLLGPSGSGKSTLMDCLNGRRPATGGKVLANGEDFYLHFDSFRQSLGYVPQRDIVHTQLSVYRALYYTARLRLPTDTDQHELSGRIGEVLRQMELVQHQETLVASLSGGQMRRVSLGAELLARPCVLYIDEATSGLDAGTETRMMHLFRHLADEGKSVLCITHNVDNVDLCNLLLILARGKLVFYGPPAEARSYFGVSRISEIYDRLAGQEPAAWETQFGACSLYQEFVEKRLGGATDGAAAAEKKPEPAQDRSASLSGQYNLAPAPSPAKLRPPLWHQFCVLTTRYVELIWRDWSGLRLLLLQAPIVAAFILLGFAHKPYDGKVLAPRAMTESERQALERWTQLTKQNYDQNKKELEQLDPKGKLPRTIQFFEEVSQTPGPIVPEGLIVNPSSTYTLLFLMVVIVLWFGCNNAAKEIVKEEAIYSRERSVNLGIFPYLASKFLVLTTITAVQALLLMVCVYGTMEVLHGLLGWALPWPGYTLDYLPQYGVLVVLSMTGVALGLLLSCAAATPDKATTLLPYVLIPQIILGGGILQIKDEPLHLIALLLSPSYWAFRAVRRGATTLPADLLIHMTYDDSVWLACAALGVQTVVLLLITTWVLRAKDVHKA